MKNSTNLSSSHTFDNPLLKIKHISNDFKLIFYLSITYGIIFVIACFLIIYGAIGLSEYLPKIDIFQDKSLTYETGQNYGGWIAILVIGLIFLISNFAIFPIITTSIVYKNFNNFDFILKKCHPKHVKGRTVQAFLTKEKKKETLMYTFNLVWSWIIAFDIFMGLDTTYNSMLKKNGTQK